MYSDKKNETTPTIKPKSMSTLVCFFKITLENPTMRDTKIIPIK